MKRSKEVGPLLYDPSGNPLHIETRTAENLTYKDIAQIMSHEAGFYQGGTTARRPFEQSVWVYGCVTIIAQSFAQIPLWLGKKATVTKGRKRGFQQISSHPILDLLEQPNEYMTKETFLESWITYLLTGGNVWIYIDEQDSTGLPRSLMVMGVGQVRPKIDPVTGKLQSWLIRTGPNRENEVGLDEMIHTRLPTPYNFTMGLPPVAAMQAQLDADYARTIFDRAFFRNNASPDAVLIHKMGPLSKQQREQIRQSWNEFHQGVERAGGLAVIGGDYDFKIWGVSHSQSQFIENRAFTREEVGTAYKVPVLLLNAVRGGALSRESMESAEMSLYDHAVFPNCNRFTSPLNQRLIRQIDPNLILDFDRDTLPVMTAYLKTKSEVLDKLVKNGVPLNEAIVMLDINIDPIEGGDKGYLPGNYVPVPALEKVKTMQPPQATPNTPAGPRAPKPKQAGSRVAQKKEFNFSDNSVVAQPLRSKLKRIMFNLRAESLREHSQENPFNLVAAKRAWARAILPYCAVVMQDTKDILRGNMGCMQRLQALPDASRAEALREVQRFSSKIDLGNPRLNGELELLVLRSTEMLDSIWNKLRMGADPYDTFQKLGGVAREIGVDTLRWTRNAAVYVAQEINEEHVCRDYSGRYAGDARIPLAKVLDCRCGEISGD